MERLQLLRPAKWQGLSGLALHDAERASRGDVWRQLQLRRGTACAAWEALAADRSMLRRQRRCFPLAMVLLQWCRRGTSVPSIAVHLVCCFLDSSLVVIHMPLILMPSALVPSPLSIRVVRKTLRDELADIGTIETSLTAGRLAFHLDEAHFEVSVLALSSMLSVSPITVRHSITASPQILFDIFDTLPWDRETDIEDAEDSCSSSESGV